MSWRLALLALVIAGCGIRNIDLDHPPEDSPSENGSGDPIEGLSALQITPTADEATWDGDALDRVPKFHAIGTFRTGVRERDVTSKVEWTLSRSELGSIAGGRFKPAAIGGRAEVRVRAGDVSTTASLLIRLDIALPGDFDSSVVRAFERAAERSESSVLEVVYPPAGAVVPANFANLRTQWHAPAELDRFELRIESEYAHLRYYTSSGVHDWLDDAQTSRYLAPSHPGESVTIEVSALSSKDLGKVVRSAPIALHVAETSLLGPVYYASTTARGLKRSELGAASAYRVLPATPDASPAADCVGCHAISRSGDRVAVSTKDQKLAIYALPDLTPLVWAPPAPPAMPPPPAMMPPAMPPADKGMMMPAPMPPMAAMPPKPPPPPPQDYAWGTFSPDGSRLAYAAKGKLHVVDTQTGAETKKVMLPKEVSVTHPDWSPDGSAIAVTYTDTKPAKSDKLVRGSSIALMRVLEDGSLEPPQKLVLSTGPDDTLVYPAFSPDGRYLAFARAAGSSKDSSTAQLYIVPADGSAPAVALDHANRPADASSASTMPTWAAASESGPTFLAFSSTRDYGDAGARRDQLWLTGLDLGALDRGEDPSAPAVWLPFQDPAESNHRALWSAAACAPRPEVCDGRDDDCNGTIDESCVYPEPEICDDGVDNDYDGVANEGCGCSESEMCDDGVDNDCDLSVDEDCKE